MRSGRRPSPEGTRMLFAGTITQMLCLVDGPKEGRHDKTRLKTRQENKGRGRENKAAVLCLVGRPRTTQETHMSGRHVSQAGSPQSMTETRPTPRLRPLAGRKHARSCPEGHRRYIASSGGHAKLSTPSPFSVGNSFQPET